MSNERDDESNPFEKYLQGRCGSAKCPFCGSSKWMVRTKNGHPSSNRILDQGFVQELNDAFLDATKAFENPGKKIESTKPMKSEEDKILDDVVVAKCLHCGFIAFFDRRRMGYLDGQQ